MLSIVMVARNVRTSSANCIRSLHLAVAKLRMESQVEFVFVDDASDAGEETEQAMLQLRSATRSPVRVMKFLVRQHYTKALAHAFSVAAGDSILFVSHDMIVTPSYIKMILAAGALDPSIGIVRGTSSYVDCFPQHVIAPPAQPTSIEDVSEFSDFVARTHGLQVVEDQMLTGDSMLIQAAALKKVGVFDPRFYGYFGDVDYGLRVRRAGLKLVCAKGAWLLHEGAAFYRHEAIGKDYEPIHTARMKTVNDAYRVFRDKWSQSLPVDYPGADSIDFNFLCTVPAPAGGDFAEKTLPDASICRML